MEDEVCRVYDLPLIWQLVKVHQMSIYILNGTIQVRFCRKVTSRLAVRRG